MARVVITGSTKGIGRGLAAEFLQRGHDVYVSSRSPEDVDRTVTELASVAADGAQVAGRACDVSHRDEVQALWDGARQAMGGVDYWINNAGTATARHEIHELPEDAVHTLVDSNLKGTIFGSQVAIRGFREQGAGALYNMLGGSFDGRRLTPRMGVYSATKAGIWILSKYLVAENREPGIIIGMISPGMLISDNWFAEQKHMSPEEWQRMRPILNILCDHVDTVTPWLVEQVLANRTSGRRIAWLGTGRMLGRFARAKLLRRDRDLFSRYGL